MARLPVVVEYQENGYNFTTGFDLKTRTVDEVERLEIEFLDGAQTIYHEGEEITYDSIYVMYYWIDSDGDVDFEYVTEQCTFSIPEGTLFETDTKVTVTYKTPEKKILTADFMIEKYRLSGLYVNFVAHPEYTIGETLDYSDLIVIALDQGNNGEDVTDKAVFSPSAGTLITEDFKEITVSYTNSEGETVTASYTPIVNVNITGITITEPNKTAYKVGETIDLTGLAVAVQYSDGTQEDITGQIDLSEYQGKTYTEEFKELTIPYKVIKEYANYISSESASTPILYYRSRTTENTYNDIHYGPAEYPAKKIASTGTSSIKGFVTYIDRSSNKKVKCPYSFSVHARKVHHHRHYDYGQNYRGEFTYYKLVYSPSTVSTADARMSIKNISENNQTKRVFGCEVCIVTGPINVDIDSPLGDIFYWEILDCDVWDYYVGYGGVTISRSEKFHPVVTLSAESDFSSVVELDTITLDSLTITPPGKTIYKADEIIDYSGVKVIANYSDETTKDVTSECVFNPPNRSVYNFDENGVDVEVIYTEGGEIFTVADTHDDEFYVSHKRIEDSNYAKWRWPYVPSEVTAVVTFIDIAAQSVRERTFEGISLDEYSTQEIPKYYMVDEDNRAYILDEENNRVYFTCKTCKVPNEKLEIRSGRLGFQVNCYENLPDPQLMGAEESEIAQYKTREVFITLMRLDNIESVSGTFKLNTFTVERIAVIDMPTKKDYNVGDELTYSGINVWAYYPDNSTENVTASIVFSPAEGSKVTADLNKITVSYTRGAKTVSTEFSISVTALTGIEVTPPHKLTYKVGEIIDYDGLKVIAYYSNGTHHTVTNHCALQPVEGSIITSSTEKIEVAFVNEALESAEEFINLNVITLDGLTITDTNVYNLGDTISYENVRVLADYSDNTSEDVSDKVTYSHAEGAAAAKDTPINVTVTYNKAAGVSVTGILILKIKIIKQLEVTMPSRLAYKRGDILDLSGLEVICRYTDETSQDVTDLITLNVTNGAVIDDLTPEKVVITYTEAYETITSDFYLEIAKPDYLEVTASKSTYRMGEILDYSGLKVLCYYTDGSSKDVTNSVILEPAKGTLIDKNTTELISVKYTEGQDCIESSPNITIKKARRLSLAGVPLNSYSYGDVLDFSGVKVTCSYYDGSSEDVSELASFNPSNGSVVTSSTPNQVTVTYLDGITTFTITIQA